MANFYGSSCAKSAYEATVWCATTRWTALSTGSSPLVGRLWLEFQVKGPTALAIGYANKNADGTYTAPTDTTKGHLVIPANSVKVIPAGDSVAVYGRAVAKAGNTSNGSKVALIEFK